MSNWFQFCLEFMCVFYHLIGVPSFAHIFHFYKKYISCNSHVSAIFVTCMYVWYFFVPTLFYVAEHRGRAVFWHSSDMYTSYPLWPGHHNKGTALTRIWLCPRTLWSWEFCQIDRFTKYVIEIYNKIYDWNFEFLCIL